MAPARFSTRLAATVALAASTLAMAATPAWSHAGHAGHRLPAGMTMWAVGSELDPLVMRGGDNPLVDDSARNAPGMTSHSTLGKAVVDGLIASRRAAAEADALATRSALTTAQATKKLSKRCQTLFKRGTGRLSKADRKRRAACLAQRKRVIDASKKVPAPTPPPAPGVSAPTAPVQGPDPTTAPPVVTPSPTPVPDTPAPTPTPAPVAGPVYGAVGVTATEGAEPFRLSRTSTTADIVNFELVNTDSQPHDLYIAPADEHGEISGAVTKIIGRTPGQVQGRPSRASVDMKLAPGRYRLICTVPGHGKMEVGFTVYAPRT